MTLFSAHGKLLLDIPIEECRDQSFLVSSQLLNLPTSLLQKPTNPGRALSQILPLISLDKVKKNVAFWSQSTVNLFCFPLVHCCFKIKTWNELFRFDQMEIFVVVQLNIKFWGFFIKRKIIEFSASAAIFPLLSVLIWKPNLINYSHSQRANAAELSVSLKKLTNYLYSLISTQFSLKRGGHVIKLLNSLATCSD